MSQEENIKEFHNEKQIGACYIKRRNVLAWMSFLSLYNCLALRTNINIAIVAMVNSTGEVEYENVTNGDVCPEQNSSESLSSVVPQNGQYNWNSAEQGLLLGCYFYGYILSNIPGGWLAHKYGFKIVLGTSMLASSTLTLLIPTIASSSFELFAAVRILIGFIQGAVPPAIQGAWGYWAPPSERSFLVSINMSGTSMGNFATLFIGGILAESFGWESVFYFTGTIAFVWSILWFVIIFDTPEKHPRISEKEKRYIIESISGTVSRPREKTDTSTPWLRMLTSLPVWATAVSMFSANWENDTITSMLPTYMANILRINLSGSGILSSLPHLMQFIFTIIGGYVSTLVQEKTTLSLIFIRKFNTFLGLMFPAVFVVLAGYVGCDVAAAVTFFTLTVAFNALTVPGCKSSAVDITQHYSGIVYGIGNTFSNTTGFLVPQIYGLILLESNSLSQWRLIFWISGAMGIAGTAFFLIFGSGSRQSWDMASSSKVKNEDLTIENICE